MPIDNFNRIFEKDDGAFAGFFSDEKITDIDDRYIASVMTKKDITKVTDQLQHSMGDFFAVFQYVLLVLDIVLIYLLTKIIIEKNENAISMSKILGFQNGEIASIYMLPTAITVLIFTGISFVILFLDGKDRWDKWGNLLRGRSSSLFYERAGKKSDG